MTIREVSEKYGISQDTLRYYERIGMIPGSHQNIQRHPQLSARRPWMGGTRHMYAGCRTSRRSTD